MTGVLISIFSLATTSCYVLTLHIRCRPGHPYVSFKCHALSRVSKDRGEVKFQEKFQPSFICLLMSSLMIPSLRLITGPLPLNLNTHLNIFIPNLLHNHRTRSCSNAGLHAFRRHHHMIIQSIQTRHSQAGNEMVSIRDLAK